MITSGMGKVFLVGAGPGDPGLLTLRGAELLSRAQVVVYDYLASPLLLKHCPSAEIIYVGKKAAQHTRTQDQINALLVAKAKEGKQVVRLKGGDPFIFGRGGEECLALAAEGIAFEVVPGITSAIAAPAYAGIPVTHRDLNSSFTLMTGHEKEEDYRDPRASDRPTGDASDLDWSVLAKLPALAFYMGVKALPRLCRKLVEHGMDPSTPAASIRWGTTPRQQTVVGTVATLADEVAAAGLQPPAMTIIGKVVALRNTLNWFESRPLFGKTVVVTRTREQAGDLTMRLMELGAQVIEAPTIELVESSDLAGIDAALRSAGGFDWIVFTSANGVSFTRTRLKQLHLDVRVFGTAKIAAIGDITARAIQDQLSLRVDLCPTRFVAEALADELQSQGQIAGGKFLLLRADIARPILTDRLRAGGAADVQDVAIYETRRPATLPDELLQALSAHQVHWITFTSSSTARNFAEMLGPDYPAKLHGIRLASIGPITTQTMQELGLPPSVEADISDIPHLADVIAAAK